MNTVVSDNHTICHLNSQTFERNKIDIGINEFCREAETRMNNYFITSEYSNLYMELRSFGENYTS